MRTTARDLPFSELDIDAIRAYANARANRSSLRRIARQIGIPHSTLGKFLAGAEPFPRTRTLVCEWYLREHRTHPLDGAEPVTLRERPPAGGPPGTGAAPGPEEHVEALLADLSGTARTEAHLRITGALGQAYRRLGRRLPDWLYTGR